MFDDADSGDERAGKTKFGQGEKLKINKAFENRFNEKNKRIELERAQAKYGKAYVERLAGDGPSDDSSSLAEDEDAVLDTEDVTMQVLTTLSKIRAKNPEIYDPNTRYFDESALMKRAEERLGKRVPKKDQDKMDYRRMVREAVKDGNLGFEDDDEDEDSAPNKSKQTKPSVPAKNGKPLDSDEETPFQMQERVKREFQQAIGEVADQEDDFLTVKKKTKQQATDEEEAFEKFLETQKQKSKEDAKAIKKAWGNKDKLSEEDQFFRNFILTQGWIDKDDDSEDGPDYTHLGTGKTNKVQQMLEEADEEDEMRAEEVAKFEEKVNFRFQQPRGTIIQTFEREQPDSMRVKDQARADKRKEKELKKQEEKESFREEMDRIKALKKDEIDARIRKLMRAGGVSQGQAQKALSRLLNEKFDESKYDSYMDNVFGEDFYADEDENEEELEKYVGEVEEKIDHLLAQTGAEDGDNPEAKKQDKHEAGFDEEDVALKPNPNLPLIMKKKLNKEEAKVLQEGIQDNLWWYCDACGRGIKALEQRFDCMECEDYTECRQCADKKEHPHKMKKFIVPEGCNPPADETIQQYVSKVGACSKCEAKIDPTIHIYFRSKENEDYCLCETCMYFSKKKKNKKDYTKVAPTELNLAHVMETGDYHKLEQLDEIESADPQLLKLIEEYNKVDFEDVISGGLKTRFKYATVPKEDFGLDDDDLIFADDKLLNRFLSVKKLAPYRQEDMDEKQRRRMKKFLALVKVSTEKNKQEATRLIELEKEEEYLKDMAKKNLKYKKKLEKFYEKKERIVKGVEEREKHDHMRERAKLTDLTHAADEHATEDPKDAAISSKRLKTYGF